MIGSPWFDEGVFDLWLTMQVLMEVALARAITEAAPWDGDE